MSPSEKPLPDIVIGRHPEFGIVASNPQELAAGAWMLRGFDFHPVPDHPALYALADQQRDGPERATRAVDLLRRAAYRVEADAEFDTFPAGPESVPTTTLSQRIRPQVAFADHARLGIIAAPLDSSARGRQLLEEHGWRHHPRLDVYTFPPATRRDQALSKLAQTTAAMHRADLEVAMQDALARNITTRRPPAPGRPAPRERHSDSVTRGFPSRTAAALATSPARAGIPGTPSAPAPASAPASPADPRAAVSRTR